MAKPISLGSHTEDDVRDLLTEGRLHALRVTDGGDGLIVYGVSERDYGRVMFIPYVAGRLDGGPKERLRKFRQIERAFVEVARKHGCVELQGGGRNWHVVLDDWKQDGGEGISLKKAI